MIPINLTPHALTIAGDQGSLELPPSGDVARLAVTRTALSPVVINGILFPVNRPTLGDISGLPEAREGVIFIVSALVAETANRPDVFSPGELVRDEAGRVIGARGLCAYAGGAI